MTQGRRSQKRLSLNITNGQAHDNTHAVHDTTQSQDNGMGRASQLRLVHNSQQLHTHRSASGGEQIYFIDLFIARYLFSF